MVTQRLELGLYLIIVLNVLCCVLYVMSDCLQVVDISPTTFLLDFVINILLNYFF